MRGRWWIASALAVGAVLVFFGQAVMRTVECAISAKVADLFVPGVGTVTSSGNKFTLWAGTDHVRYFEVLGVCSVAPFVAAAFLLAAGIVVADRLVSPRRMARVALTVTAILLVVNVIRIAGIVACIQALGFDRGYEFGHRVLGTLLILAALGVGLYLLGRPVLTPTRSPATKETVDEHQPA